MKYQYHSSLTWPVTNELVVALFLTGWFLLLFNLQQMMLPGARKFQHGYAHPRPRCHCVDAGDDRTRNIRQLGVIVHNTHAQLARASARVENF